MRTVHTHRSFVSRTGHLCIVAALAVAGLALPVARAAGQPVIVNLGVPPGGAWSDSLAISADGSTVVGYANTSGLKAFVWKYLGGGVGAIQLLNTPTSSNSRATCVNATGSVIAGWHGSQGSLWTDNGSGGWAFESLSGLPTNGVSAAYGVNGDGTVVVGRDLDRVGGILLRRNGSGWIRTDLGFLPDKDVTFPLGLSVDGNIAIGYCYSFVSPSAPRAFRWVSDGVGGGTMQDLGQTLDLGDSYAYATSASGQVVVGTGFDAEFGYRPFVWRDGPGGGSSIELGVGGSADAVSADGHVVGGQANGWAFLWTQAGGLVNVATYLNAEGVDLTGWQLESVDGISSDGTSITGNGRFDDTIRAWYVTGLPVGGPRCVSNYNGDAEMADILDLLDFLDDFGSCELDPAPCGQFGNADVNGDTLTDILDFLDFLDHFGLGC